MDLVLPNFIVIGAARSGTTWLYENLDAHPEIFLAPSKELHFFDRHYDKGIEYYAEQFSAADPTQHKAIGEVTPAYLHTPQMADRIRKDLGPDMRFILILRNPIDRLYSRFWNARAKFDQNKGLSFEQKIAQKPEFVEEGYYAEHLEQYFKHYNRDQFLVLWFDEMKANPAALLEKVWKFLGVTEGFIPPYLDNKINAASGKKNLGKSKILYYTSRLLYHSGLVKLSENVKRWNQVELQPMNKETRRKLVQTYTPHIEKLEKMLSEDLSSWKK